LSSFLSQGTAPGIACAAADFIVNESFGGIPNKV
jgi:hypothetical protein